MQRHDQQPGTRATTPEHQQPEARAADSRQGSQTAAVQEKAKEYTEKASEQASKAGHKAQEQLDAGKDKAAEGMERAAEQMRERAAGQGGVQAEAGAKVAEGMERTAGYLREHTTGEIWDDVERYVRDHPTQALLGAVAAGFVLGRILR